jgi:hypothetical protein
MEGKVMQIERISVSEPTAVHEYIKMTNEMAAQGNYKRMIFTGASYCGASFEVLKMVEYDNFQTRIESYDHFIKNTKAIQHVDKLGPKIRNVDVLFAKALPFVPVRAPTKDKKIVIRQYKIQGDMKTAVADFKVVVESAVKHYLEPAGITMLGAYQGVVGHNASTLLIIVEMPNDQGMDKFYEVLGKMHASSDEKHIAAFEKHVTNIDCVCYGTCC